MIFARLEKELFNKRCYDANDGQNNADRCLNFKTFISHSNKRDDNADNGDNDPKPGGPDEGRQNARTPKIIPRIPMLCSPLLQDS